MKWLKYPIAIFLYFLFSFTAMVAGLQGLISLVYNPSKTGRIMRAMDALAAAQLGWDGRSTISKECGRQLINGNPCRFCRYICRLLNHFDNKHCENEAQ